MAEFDETEISLKEIEELLMRANEAYHNSDSTIMSDSEYDSLEDLYRRKYIEIHASEPPFLASSGALPKVDKKMVTLPCFLGGMNKFRREHGIPTGYDKQIIISAKIDGASMLYIDNKLYSRGRDGIAQDLSFLLSYLKLPSLPASNLAVRGELVIKNSDFEMHVKKLGYKVARNVVSGLINSKDDEIRRAVAPFVNFITYELIDLDSNQQLPIQHQFEELRKLGFITVPYQGEPFSKESSVICIDDLTELLAKYRKELDYAIDGLVLHKTGIYQRVKSGFPEYLIAFKQDLPGVVTIVNDICWQTSRTRRLTPVIIIEPVVIDGVSISRVTGHHARWLMDRGIGKKALVSVIRAGQVIPEIEKVILPSDDFNLPCASVWDISGNYLLATDENDMIQIRQICHLMTVLNVKQIGEGRVTEIYNMGIRTIPEWLCLQQHQISKIGHRLSEIISTGIQNAMEHVTLPELMAGTGLFGVGLGLKRLDLIYQHYPNLLDMSDLLDEELRIKFISIHGIGELLCPLIIKGLHDFKVLFNGLPVKMRETLIKNTNIKYACKAKNNTSTSSTTKYLGGIKVLLTGFRDAELSKLITDNGGTVQSSINGSTNVLIVKNEHIENNKTVFARERGIPIMTPETFKCKYLNKVSVSIQDSLHMVSMKVIKIDLSLIKITLK